VYSILMGGLIYPIVGHWIWGGGWLGQLGFADFAGSTVVHSVGGWAGLVGTLILGARLGKYTEKGVNPVVGHSMTLATLGTFILWLGWYGFNPGSTLAAVGEMAWGSSAMQSIALITVNTTLAGCAAACVAIFIAYLQSGSWQIPWALNGALAGLVAVTAPCAWISPLDSILIGAAAGVIVYLGVLLLDRLKIDDPVGAISVHGLNGAWGLLSVGLFADGSYGEGLNGVAGGVKGLFYGDGGQLLAQCIAVCANVIYVGLAMFLYFKIAEKFVPMRANPEWEMEGLDQHEVAVTAYPDFSLNKTHR
jgi:Amt family ammonium transporter